MVESFSYSCDKQIMPQLKHSFSAGSRCKTAVLKVAGYKFQTGKYEKM